MILNTEKSLLAINYFMQSCKINFLIIYLLFFPLIVLAGGGLTPGTATSLTFNGELATDISQTWPASGSLDKAACSTSNGTSDVWYSFTASSTSYYFAIYSAFDGMIAVWNSARTSTLVCVDNNGAAASEFGNSSAFTIGQTYYIQIFPYTSSASGTYSLYVASQPYCWIGLSNTNWGTASNWANNAVPISTSNVYIPNIGSGNNPFITGGILAKANNLTINSSGILTFTGDAYNSSDGSQLIIYGDLTVNGSLNHTGSTYIYLRGASNVIAGNGDFFYGNICPIMIGDAYYGTSAGTYTLTSSIKVSHFYVYPGSNFVQNAGCSLSTSYFFMEGTATVTLNGTLEILGPPNSNTYLDWLNPVGASSVNPYFVAANLTLGASNKIIYCSGAYSSYNSKSKTYSGSTDYFYSAKNQRVVSGITYKYLEVQTVNGFTVTIGSSANITVNNNLKITNPSTAGGIVSNDYAVNIGGDLNLGHDGTSNSGNGLTFNVNQRVYRGTGSGSLNMGANDNTNHKINVLYCDAVGAGNEVFTGFGTPVFYGTVDYGGNGAQEIIGATFYNLKINNDASASNTKKLLGNILVNNDLTITKGTFDVNTSNFDVDIKGHWQNNGGTFNARSGVVFFSGANNQNIKTNAQNFYALMNTNSSSLTLQSNATVKFSLSLDGAKIVTTASYYLEIGTDVANRGSVSRTSGCIYGNCKRWFNNSTNSGSSSGLFPIGGSSVYRPFLLEYTGAPTAGGNVLLTFVESTPGTSGLPYDDAGQVVDLIWGIGYWQATATTIAGGTYTATLYDYSGLTPDDDTKLRVSKRTNSSNPWAASGTHGTTSATPISVSRTGLSGFSDFGIGRKVSENSLPVKLINFHANCDVNFVNLKWATASENNNDYFIVEKSNDLNLWSVVDIIKGQGNSNSVNEYSISDNTLFDRFNYYRLKQVDYNGDFTYFPIISVECESSIIEDLKITNNTDADNIILNINNLQGEDVTIYLIDNIGRYVSNARFRIDNNNYSYQISKSSMGNGIYHLVIMTSNIIFPSKLIITNRN